MKMDIQIRRETKKDYAEIYEVVKEAFERAEHSDGDEHELVGRLRSSDAYIPELALVAELDGKIVGQIMFTTIHIGRNVVVTVGPVAVLPELQGKDIGGMLIRAGHEIAKEMGYEFSVLLGHADYYPRFGYQQAVTFGIRAPFEVPDENYMAYNLQGKQTCLDGTVEYPKAWNI